MRAVQVRNGVCVVENDVPTPDIRDGEVLIEVHATACNRADLMQKAGKYPPPPGSSDILGLECSGIIVQSKSSHWKVGQRVMALLGGGGYAEYVAVPETNIMAIPNDMDFVQAAAIPEVFLTAFQLLRYIGNMQPGEVVLVHAAASGVGTAAIQIIKHLGGESIGTAGSAQKIEFVKKLGCAAAFNYKDSNLKEEIEQFTKKLQKQGVNLIIDPVGGSHFEIGLDVAASEARIVLYASMGGPAKLDIGKVSCVVSDFSLFCLLSACCSLIRRSR